MRWGGAGEARNRLGPATWASTTLGGDEAVGVVGVEGAHSIDDAVAAAAAVCAVAVRMRGGLGVHEVGSGGSSEVGVEGVLLVFKRKMLHLVGAFRVTMKNGGKVVSWAW